MRSLNSLLGLALVGSFAIASCNNAANNNSGGGGASSERALPLELLTNSKEADKHQLFLGFTDETSTDSSMIYIAKSLFDKDTVALKVEVLKDIKPGLRHDGTVDEKYGFVKGAIKLSSVGSQSDAFLKALGAMFKLPTTGKMTDQVVLPTVFSSNQQKADLSKSSTYSFKLFLENGEGEPAEVFATVDTYRKSFGISEKDSTFRKELIAAFEGK